jgi:predicted neutral ceramidase superfamily lipid hydrolase
MLSNMESSGTRHTPDDASSALAAADQARDRLAAGIRLPRGLFPAVAAAIAVQVGAAAVGIAAQTVTGLAVALGGVAVFLAVAALVLYQFRRINGVTVDGLASTIILGTGTTSTLVYMGTFAAATWAAFESLWWLVVAAAVLGGAAYAFSAYRWWLAYRADPVARAGGVSPRMMALFALAALAGFVVLMVGS